MTFLVVYLPFNCNLSGMNVRNAEIEKELKRREYVRRNKNREVLQAFNAFLHNQTTGGILLLICAVIAVVFATIPGEQVLEKVWAKDAILTVGDFSIGMSVRDWINDGLMAVFFFVVGLEIKREMLVGQLSSIRRSILPIMAAIGGMIVPALIFSIFNAGNPETSHGWGIPMATDIAFAIGVLSLLGSRVPVGIKIFLTALAIVDDLGAIIVLAIFYPTHALHLNYLLIVAGIMLLLFIFNRMRISNKFLYLIPGIFMWYFTYLSGIHATISGVLLAMMIPSKGNINEIRFHTKQQYLLDKFKAASKGSMHILASPEQQNIINCMYKDMRHVNPLMFALESKLHPIVNFLIMPLFALANAGVALNFAPFADGIPTLTLGVMFGLIVGKPLGIFLFSFISIKSGLASKPDGVSWLQLAAAGVLGGIGFTMSIFVNGLAFTDPALCDIGKISILMTSTLAAILGLIALAATCKKSETCE